MAWGQPDTTDWHFEIDRVEIIELDMAAPGSEQPRNMINIPNRFRVRTHIRNDGDTSVWLHGFEGKIEYHAENLETDLKTQLKSKTGWTVPGNSIAVSPNFAISSDIFTTDAGGWSATNLQEGTYMLTVIVSFPDAPAKQFVTAFNQAFFRIFPE